MADFKATAQLNIETVTDKAQSDVIALSELMRRKLNPQEFGEFTPTQDAALNQAVQSRASALSTPDKTVTPEQVKKNLQDALALQEKMVALENEVAAAQAEQNQKAEKARLEAERLNQQKEEALKFMNMQSGSWREINRNARAVLDNEKSTNEERDKAQQALNKYQEHVKTQQRLNTAINAEERSRAKLNDLSKEQQRTLKRIEKQLLSIATTEEEREYIVQQLLPNLKEEFRIRNEMKKAQEDSLLLSQQEAQAKREIDEAEGDIKDTFAGKITSAYLYYQALNAVKRVIRSAISTITELDRTLTDIAVVTSFSREEAWGLLGTYQQMAKEVGLTTTAVAELSIAFFRQGREAADALELTRTAAEFAKIAAINVNDAANFLTAAINGFNLAASDATRIIDRFAALGAGAAASAQEIAIALSKVAPAAASAGVEVDTLMAFITKGIETTREAPENIGTAFKTIFARMRQLTDIGTTIEDGVNVNRVEDSLKSIGVELRDANGFFRDLDDVLIEVGQRWDSINRNQQAYIATTLAGTRQQTRLIALFENFDRTLELIEVSQDSAGAAAIQHAEYMTGLDAATTRLRTSFQQLITSFINSDLIIGAINIINGGLELLNTTIGKIVLTLGTVFMSFNLLVKSTKLKKFAGEFLLSLTNTSKQGVSTIHLLKRAVQEVGLGFSFLGRNINKVGPLMQQFFSVAFNKGPKTAMQQAMEKLVLTIMNTGFATRVLIPLYNKLTGSTIANTAAVQANIAQWAAHPIGLVVVAITALIAGLILLVKRVRGATDTTNEFVSAWKQFFDNIARGIVNFFKSIGNLIAKVVNFFKGLPPEIRLAINVFMLFIHPITAIIGAFNIATDVMDKFGISLQRPVSKAASQMRVLNNQVKDLNKEIRESRQEVGKLEKALDEYDRLNKIIFKTKQETEDLNQVVERLQELLETDLTGVGLAILARGELERQTKEIEDKLNQVDVLVQNYFRRNEGLSWEDALNDEQFEEYLDVVPLYAQQYAKSFIEGFDAMKPEIQESLLAAIAIDPAAFLDLSRNARGEIRTLSKSIALDIPAAFDNLAGGFTLNLSAGTDITEAMRKAKAMSFSGTTDDLIDLLDESGVDLNAVDIQEYARAIGEAVETSALLETNFAAGVERAEELMKTIGDERISNAVDLVAPSLRNLADFTKEELAEIGEAGGIASVDAIQPILNKMEDSMFEPTIGKMMVDGVMTDQVIRTAEENAEIIRKAFIKAATSDNSQAALYDLWQQATRTGIINGISLKPNEAIPLVTAIENAFSDVDLSPVTIEVEQLVKDFAKISEIVKKAPSQLSTEELQMLSQYPELFEDYMNGSLGSLNDYFATAKEGILDTLNEFKDSLGWQKKALTEKLRAGDIDQESYNIQLQQLEVQENQVAALAQMLNFNSANINAIKSQISSYKSAFAEAKKIRDLQKEVADITQKSINAIRTGATGTIEAEFNRTKLNQEIAAANRQLEESMIVAQLEAQQKVLEDAQQRQIQQATEQNTDATVKNTTATQGLAGVIQAFLTNSNTITIGAGAGATTMSIQEYMDRFNQFVSTQGGLG